MGWRFVDSKKELDKGVQSGKYFAGIYLPKDFSKDLLSFTSGDINKPKIEYSINEKLMQLRRKLRQRRFFHSVTNFGRIHQNGK